MARRALLLDAVEFTRHMAAENDNATITEAQLYNHACQLLAIHESLLQDRNRNQAFFAALQSAVTPQSMVLDIGSGTGLWAIAAAKLGARHVVAIEQEPLLVGLIRNLAHENGVGDRVRVVEGRSGQVQLEGKFDVIISETIGHVIFDEQIVDIMIDARNRFAAENAAFIPNKVSLVVAPACFEGPGPLPAAIPVSYDYFESVILNVPVGLTDKRRLKLAGPQKQLAEVDLRTATSSPDLTELRATWSALDLKEVNGFAVWAEVALTEDLSIATLDTSSWSTTVYRIKPFTDQGELEFKLSLTNTTNYWTTTLTNEAGSDARSYSPAVAGTELLAQGRMQVEAFNQLRRMGLLELSARSA
jgi:SAM-dependent methyltransferase